MQAKMLVCLSIMLVFFGNLAAANEAIQILSFYSDPTGNVSMVVDLPPGTKAKPSQFRLIEDNKITATATSITPFLDSDWKLTLVFCIDKSGSINEKELEKTKYALKNLLRKPFFKEEDRLALVSFENQPRVIQWFTRPREIYKKINELGNMKGQHTVLYDAIFDSLEYVNSDSIHASSPVLKRILVITDGENDGGYRQNITEVREKALETGVAIDAVLLNAKKKNAETIQSLADDTGGIFINTDANGVETALNIILNETLNTYVVYFQRTIDTTSPKTVRVGVQFQDANKKLITNSVQAGISQSAVAKIEPPPPVEPETNHTDKLTPTEPDVKPPPPEPNGDSSQFKRVDQIYDSMDWANIAFNSPHTLNLRETAQIQLLLSLKKTIGELLKEIVAIGEKEGARVKVLNRMKAWLSGPDFQITAITDEEQSVGTTDTVEWKWEIKPTAIGRHNLHLSLTALFSVDGLPGHRTVRTFDKTIVVEVTAWQFVLDFFKKNWKWLWTVILLPISGWLWKQWKTQKGAYKKHDT